LQAPCGPGLALLWPIGGRWADVWLDGLDRRRVPFTTTVTDVHGARVPDGGIETETGAEIRVKVDFARAVASLPPGPYKLCYAVSAATLPDAPQRGTTASCDPIVIVKPETQRQRAEYLRRKAIDLVSQLRCDEAMGVIDRLARPARAQPASRAGRLKPSASRLQPLSRRSEGGVHHVARVSRGGRLEEHDLDLLVGHGTMLGAAWHDNELARSYLH